MKNPEKFTDVFLRLQADGYDRDCRTWSLDQIESYLVNYKQYAYIDFSFVDDANGRRFFVSAKMPVNESFRTFHCQRVKGESKLLKDLAMKFYKKINECEGV